MKVITYRVPKKHKQKKGFPTELRRHKSGVSVSKSGGMVVAIDSAQGVVFAGVSVCSMSDAFCYDTGKQVAIARSQLAFDAPQEDDLTFYHRTQWIYTRGEDETVSTELIVCCPPDVFRSKWVQNTVYQLAASVIESRYANR